MTDLVEKVAEAIKAEASMNYGHTETDLARAALAVAYDDLAEPTDRDLYNLLAGWNGDATGALREYEQTEYSRAAWKAALKAMLAAKRKEALGDE